ncbi:ankyrin repeat domain-containing protein [Legionella sp. km535]|uniref:ankyrin repeat domain-containing protein n=1 Tax=Legionella sp. km535 TaxID=2498107 RepID=UPI000F8CEFFE|nr:ankyrin repeat domain-containing protein [Legionella sp. km535]RUR19032.1 ankyrin repeat domain-containing protein [Legionella sp. km535]
MHKKLEIVKGRGASSSEQNQMPSKMIDKSDLHYRIAVDTYVYKGQETGTLVLNPEKRKTFFEQLSQVRSLLLREEQNPLLEEGAYSHYSRDREGEYYLTYEALTLLIQRKLRWQRASASGLAYNYRNIYVIKNNPGLLLEMFSVLSLQNHDDAKFIYIHGIQVVAFYLRNEEGVIKCFIVDSETARDDPTAEIINSIYRIFPEATIYLNNTLLQKDYYSCATFAFKCLLYFVKHGREVFPWLELNIGIAPEVRKIIITLSPGMLMPALLKMSQSRLELSDELLDSYVSYKKKITLRDYFSRYSVSFHDKSYNFSALEKKYKYLALINELILDTSRREPVNPNPECKLPSSLSRQHARYSRMPRHTTLFTQANNNIITRYLDIMAFCDNQSSSSEDADNRICLSRVRRITKKFPNFLCDYQRQFHEVELSTSGKLKKLLYIAGGMEANTVDHIALYLNYANKLLRLFETSDKAIAYLQKYAQQESKQPVHDACLFRLPVSGSGIWTREYWATLVMEHGLEALKYLPLAPRIEALRNALITQSGAATNSTGSSSNELELCRDLVLQYRYPRADENPQLAKLCHRHLIADETFNRTLEIVKNLKSFDFLPEITIRGEEINSSLSQFLFKKLPVGDYEGLFLGMETACCQSIGQTGEPCALHGMRSLMSGFYVIYDKTGQIVAQLWAWIGTESELVFDSFERRHTKFNFLCEPFVNRAAELLLQQGFDRVLIGRGNTPSARWASSQNPAKQYEPASYGDASEQKLVKEASLSRTLLEKYQVYAMQTDASLLQYQHLFAAETDSGLFEAGLADLIQTGQIDYTKLLQIICFCYRTNYAFLHRKSSQIETLLTVLLNQFSTRGESFLMIKDKDNNTVLDLVLRNGSLDLHILCLESLSRNPDRALFWTGEGKISRMAHIAARQNAFSTLTWIHTRYYPDLSWGAFIALTDEDGLSVLACAAKNEHPELVRAILLRITERDILHRLVKQPFLREWTRTLGESGPGILHFLAKYNDIQSLEYLCSKIEGTALCELLNQNVVMYLHGFNWVAKPIFVAIICRAWSFLRLLFQRFYSSDVISSFIFHPSMCSRINLLNYALMEGDRELLAFLHSYYPEEVQWLQILLKQSHQTSVNAICAAMSSGAKSLSGAMYLIDHMVSFDNLHQLLSFKPYTWSDPLLGLSEHPGSEESKRLLRKVMARYEPHRDKWGALTEPSIIRTVISYHDLDFFAEYLAFIHRDQALFDALIDEKIHDGLMIEVLRMHQFANVPLSEQKEQQFLDCLLMHCTEPQIKHVLRECDYSLVSPTSFEYLMTLAALIDEGRYWNEWASLKNRKLREGIFINARDSFVLTDRLIECYIFWHGQASVHAMLQSKFENSFHCVVHHDNLKLLQHLYPLFCSNQQWIKNLLLKLLMGTFQQHRVLNTTLWLIEQEAVSFEILQEFIGVEVRRSLFEGCYNADYCEVIVVAALWNACVRKGADAESLRALICSIFQNVFFKLLSAIDNTRNSRIEHMRELNGIKILIDEWLKFQYPDYRCCFEMANSQSADKKTLFNFACARSKMDLVQLILLRCNQNQREVLVETYKAGASENELAIVPELIALCQHYKHLDDLLELKIKITDPDTAESTVFLQASPEEQDILRTLLDEVDPERLFYCDSQKDLHIIASETIDRIWKEVQQFLPRFNEEPVYQSLSISP